MDVGGIFFSSKGNFSLMNRIIRKIYKATCSVAWMSLESDLLLNILEPWQVESMEAIMLNETKFAVINVIIHSAIYYQYTIQCLSSSHSYIILFFLNCLVLSFFSPHILSLI